MDVRICKDKILDETYGETIYIYIYMISGVGFGGFAL